MKYVLSNDTWGKEEDRAAQEVIDSHFLTMNNRVKEFEKEFAKKFGSKYAVMTNSGSSSNLIMIAALVYSGKLKRGDEVLVTSVAWSTTYFPISQMGLKVRFVDINRDTLNVDVNALEKAITPNSRAICAVNLLGNPNDFDAILEICEKHNLLLVEDNCEAMGAKYNGKYCGTFGLIGSFSMYYSHHISTIEGGMNLTDDEELYHYMLSIRSHGWTRHLPDNSPIYKKDTDAFYEYFNFIMPGFNVRPIELEAAVGSEQLKKLNGFIEQRRKNALYFQEKASKRDFCTQQEIGESSSFGFAIILNRIGERETIVQKLKEAGIETRPIVAGNFAKQKALEFMDYSIYGELKNADYIHENGLFIGNHSIDMKREIDYFFKVMDEAIQ